VNALEILVGHNLKRSSCREGIINVVLEADKALSETEIRERLKGNYDRTTFYRSFKTLEENRILHKIPLDGKLVKYELDNSITKNDGHAHFYCNECHTVKCIDSVPVESHSLPDGYTSDETEVLIKGKCADCK